MRKLADLGVKCRQPTLKNFAWLITGIYYAQSISTGRIALEMSWGSIKVTSMVRRLSRLLANTSVRVREWYRPIAQSLLQSQANALGEIRLIVDGSKVGNQHQLLMVSIAYRRRSIPIAWTWVRHKKGHSSARLQKALLSYVHGLIPKGVPVSIVGDSEFGNVPVMQLVDGWGWVYTFRQRANRLVKLQGSKAWRRFGHYATQRGQKEWLGPAYITQTHAFSTHLYIEWQPGQSEPWLLATNADNARTTQRLYKRRMWIEEMFGDFKGNGFNLERTKLRHFNRLSRLTLAVVLLFVWLIDLGSRTIKSGHRQWVDRKDRRDLSIFRIGHNMLKRRLRNQKIPQIRFEPYFN